MTDKTPVSPTDEVPPETMWDLAKTIITAMIIALFIRTLLYEPFNIPSGSMEPTLLVGDFLFVSKFSYGYGSEGTFWGLAPFGGRMPDVVPHRGDVIVFKQPKDNSTDFIKRLIGLPGDTIQMKHGILYINNQPMSRDRLSVATPGPHGEPAPDNVTDYIEHLPGSPGQPGVDHIIRKMFDEGGLNDTPEFHVPPRHYFFMGDNRDNSSDSRAPNGGVGYVPDSNLVGRADFLFFSIDDDVHFWEIWKWPGAVRWNRLFTKIGQ